MGLTMTFHLLHTLIIFNSLLPYPMFPPLFLSLSLSPPSTFQLNLSHPFLLNCYMYISYKNIKASC